MVDRGADLSFISQYPHEEEILFAPLAGFEVKHTRVEGQVHVALVLSNPMEPPAHGATRPWSHPPVENP